MNTLTVVGNLTGDPELRFTPNGQAVVNFNLAQTPRKFDNQTKQWKDASDTNYYRCTAWGEKAENIAASLTKGTRTIVIGRLKTEKYERNGETVSSTNNLDVEYIGPDLSYATASVQKNAKSARPSNGGNFGGGNGGGNFGGGNAQSPGNGFNAGSAGYDEPPF